MHMIWSYILLYVVGLTAQLLYPKTITLIQVNDSESYKPKPKWLRQLRPMTTWIQKKVKGLRERLDDWSIQLRTDSAFKLAKAKRIASRMQRPRQHKSQVHIAIAAFAAVAMWADGSFGHTNSMMFDTDSGPVGVDVQDVYRIASKTSRGR
jgi:hypothetical protein